VAHNDSPSTRIEKEMDSLRKRRRGEEIDHCAIEIDINI
jgi:hypothetical protein